jgi:TRAP-type mannitol/chloroaromatic compound transport system permease large subunit
MRLVQRKSEPDRLLETVGNSLGAVSGGVNRSTLMKAGLIAGGLAALTAGSAAISSIRRRMEGDDS